MLYFIVLVALLLYLGGLFMIKNMNDSEKIIYEPLADQELDLQKRNDVDLVDELYNLDFSKEENLLKLEDIVLNRARKNEKLKFVVADLLLDNLGEKELKTILDSIFEKALKTRYEIKIAEFFDYLLFKDRKNNINYSEYSLELEKNFSNRLFKASKNEKIVKLDVFKKWKKGEVPINSSENLMNLISIVDDYKVWLRIADYWYTKKNFYNLSLAAYLKALEYNLSRFEVGNIYLDIMSCYYEMRQLYSAFRVLKFMEENLYIGMDRANLLKGLYYYQLKDYFNSVKYLKKYLNRKKEAYPYYVLAMNYINLEEYRKAYNSINMALALSPNEKEWQNLKKRLEYVLEILNLMEEDKKSG